MDVAPCMYLVLRLSTPDYRPLYCPSNNEVKELTLAIVLSLHTRTGSAKKSALLCIISGDSTIIFHYCSHNYRTPARINYELYS